MSGENYLQNLNFLKKQKYRKVSIAYTPAHRH